MKIRFLGPIEAPPADVVESVSGSFAGGTVRDLLGKLGFAEQQVWFLSVLREQQRLSPEDELSPDDEVAIMLLVGGG